MDVDQLNFWLLKFVGACAINQCVCQDTKAVDTQDMTTSIEYSNKCSTYELFKWVVG